MHLNDAIGEIEFRVSAPRARHVAVDDRAKLFVRLRLELARLLPLIRNETLREGVLVPKWVLVPARDREQVDERIDVPEAVLNGCRCQHQHEAETTLFQRLLEAGGDLR